MSRIPPALLLLTALLAVFLCAPADADVGTDVVATLKKALGKRGTTAERIKAVNDVGALRGHLSPRQKRECYRTIHKAFNAGAESEVRRVMVKALARLDLTGALIDVVNASKNDADLTVRKEARMAILAGRTVFLETLQRLFAEDENAAFRAELLLLLRDRRKPDAIPFLLSALADKEPMIVAAAAEALEAISGVAHGYDAAAWKTWHAKWLLDRPKTDGNGGTVAPDEGPVEEPPPHVTRSLTPKFYGLKITSKDIVFVVDISGSVGAGVDDAKRKLLRAVGRLGSDVHIGAVFFAEEVKLWKEGRMVPATPENKEDLAFYLRGLKPGKRTDVYSAFNAGLRIVQKHVEAKLAEGETLREAAALIAVSDGQHNAKNSVPIDRIEDKLDRLDLDNSIVHAVVLGGKDSKLMYLLAKYGAGRYIVVPQK